MQKKAAIITGASRGIGREVAKHLALMGYDLLLISRSERLLDELKDEISQTRADLNIQAAACDILNNEGIAAAIDSFYKSTGQIDLLFNNAGYVKRGTSTIEAQELSSMLNTNLVGAINLIRLVVPIMKEKDSGYIINMCSRNALMPREFLGGYAASKAALLAFSESLYKELKCTNIKVTAMCPGFVDTEMTQDVKADRDKMIKPSDICIAIDFLLSLSPSMALKTLTFESAIQIGGYC